MKSLSLFGLAAVVLMLAGCSSTPTKVDTGEIHGRTFSFVNRGPQPAPDFVDDRAAVHEMIQSAITKDLAAKGVTRVAANGDLTVGYLIIIGNNATTEAINTYFGYGEGANALHDKAHEAYTSNSNPNYFEAGTLVIDIIDTHTHKLLKRNYASRALMRNITAEARAERIQEVVDEILKGTKFAP